MSEVGLLLGKGGGGLKSILPHVTKTYELRAIRLTSEVARVRFKWSRIQKLPQGGAILKLLDAVSSGVWQQ